MQIDLARNIFQLQVCSHSHIKGLAVLPFRREILFTGGICGRRDGRGQTCVSTSLQADVISIVFHACFGRKVPNAGVSGARLWNCSRRSAIVSQATL
jgi:hypothetical protein